MTDNDDEAVNHQMQAGRRLREEAAQQLRQRNDDQRAEHRPAGGPQPAEGADQRELERDLRRDDVGRIEIEKILREQRPADGGQCRRQRHGRIRISRGLMPIAMRPPRRRASQTDNSRNGCARSIPTLRTGSACRRARGRDRAIWLLNTMSAALAIGEISSPSGTAGEGRQLSAAMRVTSPAASVDRMKNGPRNRAHTAVNSAPAQAASARARDRPIQGGRRSSGAEWWTYRRRCRRTRHGRTRSSRHSRLRYSRRAPARPREGADHDVDRVAIGDREGGDDAGREHGNLNDRQGAAPGRGR